jgi:hypothetical protein
LDVAGLPVTQVAEEVITTVTTSLLESVADVKVGLFVPTFKPLTFHWKTGVPPLVGVAVKVTEVPVQTAPEGEAAITTLAGSAGLTTTVIGLEVAGLPDVQGNDEVITTLTTSLLESVVDV